MSFSKIQYLNWNQINSVWSSSDNNWSWDSVLIEIIIGKSANVNNDDPYNQYEYDKQKNRRNILIEFSYREIKKAYRKTLNENLKLVLTEAKIDEEDKKISLNFEIIN